MRSSGELAAGAEGEQSSFSFASELRECRPRGACSLSETAFDDVHVEDFTLELSPTGRDHRAEMRSTRGDVGVTQTAPVVERIEREVANVDVELAGQARATVDTVASALVQLKWNAGTPGETENFFNHPWRFYADRTWTYDGVEPNGERTWTVCLEGTLIVLRVDD